MNHPNGFIVIMGDATGNHAPTENYFAESMNAFESIAVEAILNLVENSSTPTIELVATPSPYPVHSEADFKTALEASNKAKVLTLAVNCRKELDEPGFLDRLNKCDAVIFTGCDQLRLCSILGGSEFLDVIKKRYQQEHLVIAGTNAAAMAMSHTMTYGRLKDNGFDGNIKMSIGLGLLSNVILDNHFEKPGSFNYLARAVAMQPGITGIGLGANTGIIISKGRQLKVIGNGVVTIIDGRRIMYNNIADVRDDMPVSIHNLSVHILTAGDEYDLGSSTCTYSSATKVPDDEN